MLNTSPSYYYSRTLVDAYRRDLMSLPPNQAGCVIEPSNNFRYPNLGLGAHIIHEPVSRLWAFPKCPLKDKIWTIECAAALSAFSTRFLEMNECGK